MYVANIRLDIKKDISPPDYLPLPMAKFHFDVRLTSRFRKTRGTMSRSFL